MGKIAKKVALLATGNEIINGETLDTNSAFFAQHLFDADIQPGLHMTASDDENELTQCILYLLDHHPALITIGGLGPTSDDRTRYALAKALKVKLIFHEPTWQQIVTMLKDKVLAVPETNKVQCWFPEGAEIIPNRNGTAFACYIRHNDKDIFMLPGPPNECRPIFHEVVLPKFLTLGYQQTQYRQSWLLFDVSESAIAQDLDPLAKNSDCYIGYRVHYPYLEVKIQSDSLPALESLSDKILPYIKNNLVSTENKKASEQFYEYLRTTDKKIYFNDTATLGTLQNLLISPKTYKKVFFCAQCNPTSADFLVKIEGISEYWEDSNQKKFCDLKIEIIHQGRTHTIKQQVPYRGRLSLCYASELVSLKLINFFNEI